MKKLMTMFLIMAVATSLSAGITNGGFETGDFTGWSTIGVTSIETVAYGAGPTKGLYQALVIGEDGSLVSDSTIETFLGLPVGTLDGSFGDDAIAGSAIRQTITVSEGDTLTFDWNFLTDEVEEGDNVPDFAFVSISDGFTNILADAVFTIFFPSNTPFNDETGFAMFSSTFTNSGTFILGFGVMHVEDNDVDSGLLLDNVAITPEPATITILSIGSLALLRRKKQ